MVSKKSKKVQASLEYLLTYGWALIMIVTIIGVLVFVTGSGINANLCTTFLSMICKGIGADGDTIVLILQNTTGQKITINPFFGIRFDDKIGYAIITYQGNDYKFEDVTIGAGDEFTISAKGMALATEVSITYTENATGLTKTVTSSLKTDAPNSIELSNDGIDNDGDDLVDCAAIDTTFCQYVLEAGFVTGINITALGETIQIGALEGSSGNPVLGNWKTETVSLAFFVESFDPGAMPRVSFAGNISSGEPSIKQGWNIVEVNIIVPVEFTGNNVPDFTLQAQGAASFTINDSDKMPKAYIVVNPPEDKLNGLDDDGDGLVDCADPDVSNCVYINEATAGFNPIVQAGLPGSTIQFGPMIGTSGAIVEGTWKMENAIFSFYVESLEPGATNTLTLAGTTVGPTAVVPGWNSQPINIPGSTIFSGDNAPDIIFKAQVGDITLNNSDEMPLATWMVNTP